MGSGDPSSGVLSPGGHEKGSFDDGIGVFNRVLTAPSHSILTYMHTSIYLSTYLVPT
jgi:hypothetical protein